MTLTTCVLCGEEEEEEEEREGGGGKSERTTSSFFSNFTDFQRAKCSLRLLL